MNKTLSGIMLIAGIAVAVIAAAIGRSATNTSDMNPSLDWYYALIEYGSMAGIVAGLAMFGIGAMLFARAK